MSGTAGPAGAETCRPWPRRVLDHAAWTAAARSRVLAALWADTVQAHAILLDPAANTVLPVSTPVEGGRYPALSPVLPGAAHYERMIRDLWGHEADGAADARPWLDHGTWPQPRPMAPRAPPPGPPRQPDMPEDLAGDLALLPLGPVWGRIDEAAHVRLTLDGPAIRRAEARLGFTHKGALALMRGKSPRAAARFAARLSGDATVAHSVAFAQASEAASGTAAPARAAALRTVMAEIERIATHLDNLAEVGRLAGAPAAWTICGRLREILLRATQAAFGHRLMMDCVVPGGVAADIAGRGPEAVLRALGAIASELPAIRAMHGATVLATRLNGLGRTGDMVFGGVAGRAAGLAFDARSAGLAFDARAAFPVGRAPPSPRIATHSAGDAAARQQVRLREIAESLRLVSAELESMPDGPLTVALPQASGEGIACAESGRGDVWHWVRLDHGQIAAVFPRDPGWALWAAAERMLESVAIEDIDLLRASLALPASGVDL
jgi:Ni,Fe-hydrogenase III large subunit